MRETVCAACMPSIQEGAVSGLSLASLSFSRLWRRSSPPSASCLSWPTTFLGSPEVSQGCPLTPSGKAPPLFQPLTSPLTQQDFLTGVKGSSRSKGQGSNPALSLPKCGHVVLRCTSLTSSLLSNHCVLFPSALNFVPRSGSWIQGNGPCSPSKSRR